MVIREYFYWLLDLGSMTLATIHTWSLHSLVSGIHVHIVLRVAFHVPLVPLVHN